MTKTGTVYLNDNTPAPPPSPHVVRKEKKKLDKLIRASDEIIYSFSSVFPFQLFPDKIIIDENKVTIIRKMLFFKRIFPILIDDILTVKVNRNIFFASIEFEIKDLEENPSPTTFLWPGEASLAKKYIMGLMQARRNGVDLQSLTSGQLKKRLEELGGGEAEAETLF